MTLPQRVFYVVKPKPICETLRAVSDAQEQFFLFRECALSIGEAPVEDPEGKIGRAKIAFLGAYWPRLTPAQVELLFGDERNPLRMFDRAWDLVRYSQVFSIIQCLEAIDFPFLDYVTTTEDEGLDSLLAFAREEAALPRTPEEITRRLIERAKADRRNGE